jgi:hypothetical protein
MKYISLPPSRPAKSSYTTPSARRAGSAPAASGHGWTSPAKRSNCVIAAGSLNWGRTIGSSVRATSRRLLLDRRRQRLGQAKRPCGCGVRRARNAIFNLFHVHDAQGPGNGQLSPARSPTGPSTNIVASEYLKKDYHHLKRTLRSNSSTCRKACGAGLLARAQQRVAPPSTSSSLVALTNRAGLFSPLASALKCASPHAIFAASFSRRSSANRLPFVSTTK